MNFDEYFHNSPEIKEVNYWDLPKGLKVKLSTEILNKLGLKVYTKYITINKILAKLGKNKQISQYINKFPITNNRRIRALKVKLPLNLDNIHYVRLYSLMRSEGTNKNDFHLQVPEKEFHNIFKNSIKNLFGISKFYEENIKIKRIRATTILRYFIPIPIHIPRLILENKEYAKEYLRIAFEAEANFRFKILANKAVNRRIRLTRNVGIDNLITENLNYPLGKRVPISQVKKDFSGLYLRILNNPCKTILGEKLMLEKYFNIHPALYPEYLRVNKTPFRTSKISVKWSLTIHSIFINNFVEEIGCLSDKKKKIAKKMASIKPRNPKFNSLNIMMQVSKNNVFHRDDFYKEMRRIGYVAPRTFVSAYLKKGLIKQIGKHEYLILS